MMPKTKKKAKIFLCFSHSNAPAKGVFVCRLDYSTSGRMIPTMTTSNTTMYRTFHTAGFFAT